ncbi:MAG: hypothetical protein OEM52_06280, partial [bacterium]|nr:hypothetical protein [bacterium]
MLLSTRISYKLIIITSIIVGVLMIAALAIIWNRLYQTAESLLIGQAAGFAELAEQFKAHIVPMGGDEGNAGMEAAKKVAAESGFQFHVFAQKPINPDFSPENAKDSQ